MRTAGVALVIAVAVLLGSALGASAATVSMTSSGLVVDTTGDGTAKRDITVLADSRNLQGGVARWGVDIQCGLAVTCVGAGPGCRTPGAGEPHFASPATYATCDRTAAGVTVNAGGGDDLVELFIDADHATVNLGAGNDYLKQDAVALPGLERLPNGHWDVNAGPGNDRIEGSTGGNTIFGGTGDDNIKAFPFDPGTKTIPAKDHPEMSAGDSIFGEAGNDTIDAGFGPDAVSGGDGNDTFVAGPEGDFAAADGYDGGAGFDTIDYTQRTSDLFFDSGSVKSGATAAGETDKVSLVERAKLGAGNDTALSLLDVLPAREYDGNAGDDVLNGIDGSDDVLDGGLGADKMNGFGGNDTIRAKDGIADTSISCGAGTDTAQLDLKDPNPVDAAQCETITREAVMEAPLVRIVSAHRRGRMLDFVLSCPRNDDRSCTGTLGAAGHAARYSISRGRTRTVRVAGGGSARRVRVRSVEHGLVGDKTVIRTLAVKR